MTETTYEVSVDLYGIDQNKKLGGYMICIHARGSRSQELTGPDFFALQTYLFDDHSEHTLTTTVPLGDASLGACSAVIVHKLASLLQVKVVSMNFECAAHATATFGVKADASQPLVLSRCNDERGTAIAPPSCYFGFGRCENRKRKIEDTA